MPGSVVLAVLWLVDAPEPDETARKQRAIDALRRARQHLHPTTEPEPEPEPDTDVDAGEPVEAQLARLRQENSQLKALVARLLQPDSPDSPAEPD